MANDELSLGAGARRIDPFSKEADIRATVNLLVPAKRTVQGQRVGDTGIETPDRGSLETLGNDLASRITNAMNIGEMLPDIELMKRLLVASIISPQDMVSTEISFVSTTKVVTGKLVSEAVNFLTEFFTDQYKVKEMLPKALEQSLFTHGSYPIAVIPESGLDNLINKGGNITKESLALYYSPECKCAEPSGLLGNGVIRKDVGPIAKQGVSFESVFEERLDVPKTYVAEMFAEGSGGSIRVVDNVNVLKFPGVVERVRQNVVTKSLVRQGLASSYGKISLEAYAPRRSRKDGDDKLLKAAVERLSNKTNTPGNVSVALFPTETYKRTPVGHPLTMVLPPESLIPVHVPGNSDKHIAYFLLVDEYGNPIHRAKGSDYYKKMRSNLANTDDRSTNHRIVSTIYSQISGGENWGQTRNEQQFYNSYATAVQADLLGRLKSGQYNTGVELGQNNEIYRIMLARQLANMGTQLLFIPAELVTYFAFDYDEYGMGRSLVDKSKILGTMRTAVMFSNTMAALRKATPAVNLNIELDPDDQDPQSTVNDALHQFSKTRSTAFLLDAADPRGIVDHINNANISVLVSGNPNYPETKISQEDRQQVAAEIDTDYEDDLRRRYIQSFGLLPEIVDNSLNVEFAQSIVSGNLMMAKMIKIFQDTTILFCSDHLQRYVYNSGHLMRGLLEIIVRFLRGLNDEDYTRFLDTFDFNPEDEDEPEADMSSDKVLAMLAEAVLFEIVDTFKISLPEPDVAKFESQSAALEEYIKVLDQTLPAYIEQALIQGVFQNEAADSAEAYTKSVRALFIRDWLRKNHMMPELEILCRSEDDDQSAKTIATEVLSHAESIQRTLEEYTDLLQDNAREFSRRLEAKKQNEEELFGGSGDDSGSSDAGGDDYDSGGGDDFGGNDDGMDDMGDDGGEGDDAGTEDTDADTGDDSGDEGKDDADKSDDAEADKPDAGEGDAAEADKGGTEAKADDIAAADKE